MFAIFHLKYAENKSNAMKELTIFASIFTSLLRLGIAHAKTRDATRCGAGGSVNKEFAGQGAGFSGTNFVIVEVYT